MNGFTINLREFNAVCNMAVLHTERTYPQFVNGQLFRLTTFAIESTQKADAARIGYTLGQTGIRLRRDRKTGKLKRGTNIYDTSENSLAARIINKRRIDRGEKPIFGTELAKAVRKFIGASLRSVNFIKSGWVPAAKRLAAAVGLPVKTEAKVRGQEKGSVSLARPEVSGIVFGEIANTALLAESAERTGSRKGDPMPIAESGLQVGANRTTADILQHLSRKLGPVFQKFSAV